MKKEIISRNFSRSALQYEANARLQKRVAQELVRQCGNLSGQVLDIGAGPGVIAKNSDWNIVSLDISYDMCALADGISVNADAEHLPFQNEVFAHVVSSLSLQWVEHLENTLAEIFRVLQPGGKFSFSTFAPSSLAELKAAFTYLDSSQHLMEFEHAIRIFAMLKKTGFENLIMKSQKISYQYPDIFSALHSIKNIGASYNYNLHMGLRGKDYFKKLENIYRGICKCEGDIPLKWEVLYIHAEKA